MDRLLFYLFTFFFLSLTAPPGKAASVTSQDFGYGYLLKLQGDGPVYSLQLPRDVYSLVQRDDLGDIQVFNGAGEQVPFSITPATQERVQQQQEIPFFPLYDQGDTSGPLSLVVSRNNDGTIIELDVDQDSKTKHHPPSGYLLDLGENSQQWGSLELFWQLTGDGLPLTVSVEQSTDLQRWTSLVRKRALVDMAYNGNQIVQRVIRFPVLPKRYLRLQLADKAPPLLITRVVASSRPENSPHKLQWSTLYNGTKINDNGRLAVEFSSKARLPVSHVRLKFADSNSIISGAVQSRQKEGEYWQQRCEDIFYSIRVDGENISSAPCSFTPVSHSNWRVVVNDDGAGLSDTARNIRLELGWQSDTLLFLARGSGPFLLAYGSGKLNATGFSNRSPLIKAAAREQQGPVLSARVDKRLELGGEEALRVPPPPTPWKKWGLWAVLVIGVVVMAVMIIGLVRDMKKGDGAQTD